MVNKVTEGLNCDAEIGVKFMLLLVRSILQTPKETPEATVSFVVTRTLPTALPS